MKNKKQFELLNEALDKMCALIKEINKNEELRQKASPKPPFAKGGIISKRNPDSEPIIPEYAKTKISPEYLMDRHPFLTINQAKDLYEYCVVNTIVRKECYGNGRTMLHSWLDYKLHIPKNYND